MCWIYIICDCFIPGHESQYKLHTRWNAFKDRFCRCLWKRRKVALELQAVQAWWDLWLSPPPRCHPPPVISQSPPLRNVLCHPKKCATPMKYATSHATPHESFKCASPPRNVLLPHPPTPGLSCYLMDGGSVVLGLCGQMSNSDRPGKGFQSFHSFRRI